MTSVLTSRGFLATDGVFFDVIWAWFGVRFQGLKFWVVRAYIYIYIYICMRMTWLRVGRVSDGGSSPC